MELSAEWRPCERLSCSAIAVRFSRRAMRATSPSMKKDSNMLWATQISQVTVPELQDFRFKITDKLQFNMKAGHDHYDRDEIALPGNG